MSEKEKKDILAVVENLRNAFAGEATQVADWIEVMIENITVDGETGGHTATEIIVDSLRELIDYAQTSINLLEKQGA